MISYSICFSVWLISLTIIPPSPSTLLQMVTFFFFWQSNTPLCVYIYVCVYMYTPPARPHCALGSLMSWPLWLVLLFTFVLWFFLDIRPGENRWIMFFFFLFFFFFFFFLRKHHIVFHRGCTALCSHKDHKLSKTDLNSNPGFLSCHGQMSEWAT